MVRTYCKLTAFAVSGLLLFILAACGGSDTSGSAQTNNGNTKATGIASTAIVSSPVVSTPVARNTAPGTGPIVILSPTTDAAGSQIVTLPDRTLVIRKVSKQTGVDANTTGISVTMTIKSTSTASIKNQASYFQLVGAEGDAFGLQSSATASFFGTIAAKSSRSGTIVFQVPSSAISGLRLFYRSEIASETVFVSLNVH